MNAARFRLLASVLGLWIAMVTASSAHPHNNSIGTAEWIEDAKALEVGLKMSVDDLEDLLNTKKKEVRLGNSDDKSTETALKGYILKHLNVTSPEDQTLPVEWIGYEVEESDTWIYLLFKFPGANMKGCKMTNSLLVAKNELQVNFINVKKGKQRTTLKFNKRHTKLKLPNF
jgi:hypothetical protein